MRLKRRCWLLPTGGKRGGVLVTFCFIEPSAGGALEEFAFDWKGRRQPASDAPGLSIA
jgi:hypothetical protein